MDRSTIEENLIRLRSEIFNVAGKADRSADIQLVAVSKNVSVERIQMALQAGVTDLGENKVQELLAKQPHFGQVNWHLIGHLQVNKVKKLVGRTRLIHSLDSWRLAEEIDRRSREMGIVSEVLVQVNISGEDTKAGMVPSDVSGFIRALTDLPGLSVRGLMTVAPLVDDPELVRPIFKELRELFSDVKNRVVGVKMKYLSMGMTNDYRVAIEEGANILRVGTGIFGDRL